MYKIVRSYGNDHTKQTTIKTGLTLEEALTHCRDPETSSSTCTRPYPKQLTKRSGPWFDSYTSHQMISGQDKEGHPPQDI